MGARDLLWSAPLVFLLHDLEEIATVEAWTRSHRALLPAPLRAYLPVSTREFTLGLHGRG